jgi:hypothetical protein
MREPIETEALKVTVLSVGEKIEAHGKEKLLGIPSRNSGIWNILQVENDNIYTKKSIYLITNVIFENICDRNVSC